MIVNNEYQFENACKTCTHCTMITSKQNKMVEYDVWDVNIKGDAICSCTSSIYFNAILNISTSGNRSGVFWTGCNYYDGPPEKVEKVVVKPERRRSKNQKTYIIQFREKRAKQVMIANLSKIRDIYPDYDVSMISEKFLNKALLTEEKIRRIMNEDLHQPNPNDTGCVQRQ